MSLISAVEGRDIHNIGKDFWWRGRTSSITSSKKSLKHGSKSLKTKGIPDNRRTIKQEALYKAKLKYGVYQSPAQSYSIGVSDAHAASDKAANLAHDNQTTVEATNVCLLTPNATKAASKMGPKVVRNNSITSTSKTSKNLRRRKSKKESPGAATSAYSMTMETTSLSSQTNSRSYSITSASSVLSGAVAVSTVLLILNQRL
ncbi:BTE_HP_G0221970.mRNA.1.CDS.1 [Saccharomyces cerevisiae]|nr:BTE_HP_G0221970.mRNA.1.CDS.1 [Saccharomyces cerevisiae]CAI6435917.1 BTE_HP_G0221970.mRNA.1.CDS.1 [Saccharomyces cerevisiae]